MTFSKTTLYRIRNPEIPINVFKAKQIFLPKLSATIVPSGPPITAPTYMIDATVAKMLVTELDISVSQSSAVKF